MNYTDIENILSKKVTGEATSSELAILDNWRVESQENQDVYNQYSILWEDSINYETEINFNFESALDNHLQLLKNTPDVISGNVNTSNKVEHTTTKSARIFSLKRLSSIAAIFVLGLAAILLFNNKSATINAGSCIQFVSLDDGSSVWLDKESSLTFNQGFGIDHRTIELKGKAFFDVERNESLPFTIEADDLNISVLGTSFTVSSDDDYVEVSTGTVKVNNKNSEVILKKNDKVELINGDLQTSTVTNNHAKWRNPNLSFDNSPLSQVVSDVNLFFNNRVVLKSNVELANCEFTSKGGLAKLSLEEIIEILKLNFDFELEKTQTAYEITISNCN